MKHQPNTTITEPLIAPVKAISHLPESRGSRAPRGVGITAQFCSVLTLVCILLTLAAPMFAHGGFDHVIGTVSKVDHHVVTVKTAKGEVEVTLTDKTEITRGDQKAAVSDLKPGVRVVVDVPEGSKDRVAHSVKLGIATHK